MKHLDARFYLDTTTARLLSENSRDWRVYAANSSRFPAPYSYREGHEMNEKSEEHSFLDEFLQKFKFSLMRFLDRVCGCGKFLVVSYRKQRLLNFEVVQVISLRTGHLVNQSNYYSPN